MIEIRPLCTAEAPEQIKTEQRIPNFSLQLIIAAIHHGASQIEFRERQGVQEIVEWVDGTQHPWPAPPAEVFSAILYHYHAIFPIRSNPAKVKVQFNQTEVRLRFQFHRQNDWTISWEGAEGLKGQCSSLLAEFWKAMDECR